MKMDTIITTLRFPSGGGVITLYLLKISYSNPTNRPQNTTPV